MRIIPKALKDRCDHLIQQPTVDVTIERWLPRWAEMCNVEIIAGENSHYAFGHSACVSSSALFRCRTGDEYFPHTGRLFVAIISGNDLNYPHNFENHWINTDIDNLLTPVNDEPNSPGGMLDCIDDPGNSRFLVLGVTDSGRLNLYRIPYSYGAGTPSYSTITTLTEQDMYGAQFAFVSATEFYLHRLKQVEPAIPGTGGWGEQSIWGSFIERYVYSGGWKLDDSFYFHTHAESGLARDSQFGNNFSDATASDVTKQWGFRPNGGFAIFPRTNGRIVAIGRTFWRRYGYNTHNQNIASYIHYHQAGLWERGFEIGNADFEDGYRLDYDSFARGSMVGTRQILVWTRLLEPSDFMQEADSIVIPRNSEVVYAVIDETGKNISSWQYLGDPRYLNCAKILKIN
ncbi:MAG: hypothetical protein GY869_05805, partial [Planctomycetes bacterium]|nr:hypothetical protein [Planctomycetota bacterium]